MLRIKIRLALVPLLLLSKSKPPGRYGPRRQLRPSAMPGFDFVGDAKARVFSVGDGALDVPKSLLEHRTGPCYSRKKIVKTFSCRGCSYVIIIIVSKLTKEVIMQWREIRSYIATCRSNVFTRCFFRKGLLLSSQKNGTMNMRGFGRNRYLQKRERKDVRNI